MVLQASGQISMGDIVAEFGGEAPHALSEYYKGGAYVQNIAQNAAVPTSGQIKLSDFYGAGNISDHSNEIEMYAESETYTIPIGGGEGAPVEYGYSTEAGFANSVIGSLPHSAVTPNPYTFLGGVGGSQVITVQYLAYSGGHFSPYVIQLQLTCPTTMNTASNTIFKSLLDRSGGVVYDRTSTGFTISPSGTLVYITWDSNNTFYANNTFYHPVITNTY